MRIAKPQAGDGATDWHGWTPYSDAWVLYQNCWGLVNYKIWKFGGNMGWMSYPFNATRGGILNLRESAQSADLPFFA